MRLHSEQSTIWLFLLVCIFRTGSLTFATKSRRVTRVVNGHIVNYGFYVVQNEENPKAVLTVANDDLGKFHLEGEPLNKITTSKWRNGEDQKWTVKLWGKRYFRLYPGEKEKEKNALTYKVYMEDFPIPNIWEIYNIGNGKHWQIKKYRGKCLTYLGMEKELGEEKCDKRADNQLWHFHLLNE